MKKADKILPIYAIKRKKGTVYQAKYRSKGEMLTKIFDRKVDAVAWLKDHHVRERTEAETQIALYRNKTIKWLCAYWLENYAAIYKQKSSYVRDEGLVRNQIVPHLGSYRIGEIRPRHVEEWLGKLKAKLAPKTCNDALGLLKKVYNDSVRWEMAASNPIAAVKRFKLPEQDFCFWTIDEKVAFLTFVLRSHPKLYPLFLTALQTGMRAGELAGLKWDCVEFSRRQITVKRTYCLRSGALKESTKSSKIRRLPMSKNLFGCLIQEKGNAESGMVFTGFDFSHPSRNLKRLCRECGVPEIRFHDLRHVFASHLAMSGISLYELQKLLGHQTIQMTERYSHLMPNALDGLTDVLDVPIAESSNVYEIGRRR